MTDLNRCVIGYSLYTSFPVIVIESEVQSRRLLLSAMLIMT